MQPFGTKKFALSSLLEFSTIDPQKVFKKIRWGQLRAAITSDTLTQSHFARLSRIKRVIKRGAVAPGDPDVLFDDDGSGSKTGLDGRFFVHDFIFSFDLATSLFSPDLPTSLS